MVVPVPSGRLSAASRLRADRSVIVLSLTPEVRVYSAVRLMEWRRCWHFSKAGDEVQPHHEATARTIRKIDASAVRCHDRPDDRQPSPVPSTPVLWAPEPRKKRWKACPFNIAHAGAVIFDQDRIALAAGSTLARTVLPP